MFKRTGLIKPKFLTEWLLFFFYLILIVIFAFIILSFPLCIFGVFLQLIGEWLNIYWLTLAGETIATIFAYIAAIISGTLGSL